MKALEAAVRGIEKDGLVWGASKLVPVGFGIKKLQINLVIEDDKIGLDDLQEEIATEFEEYVQSSDIVSFLTPIKLDITSNRFAGCYAKAIELFWSFRLLFTCTLPHFIDFTTLLVDYQMSL
jgi:translation elongation factor EF-1beta